MVILSKFAETLSACMEEHNVNAPALGKILKTDRSNITRYLRGERLPGYSVFISLLEFSNTLITSGINVCNLFLVFADKNTIGT